MRNLCQLDELGLSCIGCCGHNFGTKEELESSILKNTLEHNDAEHMLTFRDRAKKENLRKSGLCRNVIEKNGRYFCPLHPLQNNGKELRKGHCDIGYECKTFFEFNSWAKKKQDSFIKFLEKKHLDNIDYSIGIDSGSLLKEFKQAKNK